MDGWPAGPVFSVGDARYDWADVLLAAHLRGDWAALETQIRQGLACQRALDNDDESEEADPQAVDAAAAEFRYARDLVSAEEAEAWLTEHGLTTEGWLDYIERDVLRDKHAEELDELVERYPVTDDEVAALAWAEGMCSGRLATFARALAARVVVGSTSSPAGLVLSPADLLSSFGRTIPSVVRHCLPHSHEIGGDRLDRLAALEHTFQLARAATPSQELLRRQLANHWLEWVRVGARYVLLGDEQAAREIVLSVREDARSLDEVAADARVEVQDTRAYLNALPAVLRDPLLTAGRGDVLGPVPLDGGFAVFVIDDKVAPSIDDPALLARATTAILDGWVEREITDRVRWLATL